MAHPEFRQHRIFSQLKWVQLRRRPLEITEIARVLPLAASVPAPWFAKGYGLTETRPVVVHSTSFHALQGRLYWFRRDRNEMKTVDDDGQENAHAGEPGAAESRAAGQCGLLQRPRATAENLLRRRWLEDRDSGR